MEIDEEDTNSPDWSEINGIFGHTVTSYLKDNGCKIDRSKTGVYVLSENDRTVFNDCVYLVRNQKNFKKKNKNKLEMPVRSIPYKPKTVDVEGEDNIRLFDGFKRALDFAPADDNNSLPCSNPKSTQASSLPSTSKTTTSENMNAENYARQCKNLNTQKYRDHQKFTKNNINEEMFKNLLKLFKDDYKECIPIFKLIVQIFIKNHRSFRYNIFLDSIPQDESLLDGQLSYKQINYFFNQIFFKVVPILLFGSSANLRKIQTVLRNYLQTAGGEYFCVKKLMNNLNTDCIMWLDKVVNKEERPFILLKVVEWFFEQFIWGLISRYFYFEKNKTVKKKIIFRRWKKKAATFEYVNKQVALNVYKPINAYKPVETDAPIADLVLHTKTDGVRPILSTVANPLKKEERRLVNQILRQLYLKNHDSLRAGLIHNIWRNFTKNYVDPQTTPLYFVSCDVVDAFGSIIQKKLLKIIFDTIDELPNKNVLVSRWFTVLNPRDPIKEDNYKESLAPDSLPIMLPSGTLCCLDTKVKKKCKSVKIKFLKKIIESYILKQHINVNGKNYVLQQGIGQGLTMSNIFCNFYYGDMVNNEFSEFLKDGHLFRYVDDILYLTKNKKSAKRFLEKIDKGVKSYNCNFKSSKTQSNLSPYNNEEFVYLGYRFNIKNKNVIPEYSTSSMRYSISASRPSSNLLNIFVLRIANHIGLKLCSLIMDSSINSEEVILNILKRASTHSAQRCLVLLINMFDPDQIDNLKLFKIIKTRCVQPLLVDFRKLLRSNKEHCIEISMNKLKYITWSSYFEVFRRNTCIKQLFLRLIRSQYKFIIDCE